MSAERNLYKDDVDFAALALQYPEFNKHLKKNGQLDFSDPEAVKQLTYSLLKQDFKLTLDLPNDRLCPPVPNRLNYILWIQDLLDTTGDSYNDRYDPGREVIGLDIGTGASCIYPLLGCASRPNWRFVATELDEKNLQYARQNILANNLKSRIRPVPATKEGKMIPLDELGLESIDFTMTNPPFYTSTAELLALASSKSRPPFSACTGAEVEMVIPGGEVAFVTRVIEESLVLRERVHWYSSMLGKLSSVGVLVEKLKARGVANWAATEFKQGGKTRRWAIAWSWGDMRPREDVARHVGGVTKALLPFPSEANITKSGGSVDEVAAKVDTAMNNLDLQWRFKPSLRVGVGFAGKDVWSRSARRRRTREARQDVDADKMDEDGDEDVALGFRIEIRESKECAEIYVRWLQGNDSVLFESFCGMVKRMLNL